jgi:GNAT superfamily N-acetyltransferase
MPHRLVKLSAERDAVRLQRLLERCSDYYELHEGWPTPADAGEYELKPDPAFLPKTVNLLVFALEGSDGTLDAMVQIATDHPVQATWWIGLLVVAPELRSRGLGAQLIQHTFAAALEAGIATIQLGVSLRRGLQFWENAGFRDTGKTFSVTARSGHGDQGRIMVRRLADEHRTVRA